MGLTEIGIVVIDVVFAAALIAAVSCLAYLVYLTIREHAELKATARTPTSATKDSRERAGRRALKSLRPSAAHHRGSSS